MRSTRPTPIDPRGPRFNQGVLATAVVVGFLFDLRWIVPVFAVVLLLGAVSGARFGPFLRLYAEAIKPRLDPPSELEDPRPPRFASSVGVVFLTAATIAFALGAASVGWVLALIVAALAGLSAITGICVGCEIYLVLARWRGVRWWSDVIVRLLIVLLLAASIAAIALRYARARRSDAAIGVDGLPGLPRALVHADANTWVIFTTPLCVSCDAVETELRETHPADAVVKVDATEEPQLAERYQVRRAPTVVHADQSGRILQRLVGAEAVLSR